MFVHAFVASATCMAFVEKEGLGVLALLPASANSALSSSVLPSNFTPAVKMPDDRTSMSRQMLHAGVAGG